MELGKFEEFFPKYLDVIKIDNTSENRVDITLKSNKKESICPDCKVKSKTVACCYKRHMQDKSILGKPTYLEIKVRKYKCNNTKCAINIFTEKIEGFAKKSMRYTNRLDEAMTTLGLTTPSISTSRS